MISNYKKNTSIFFVSLFALFNLACNFNPNLGNSVKDLQITPHKVGPLFLSTEIKKEIDFKKGFSIQLKISPAPDTTFKTKSSSDGSPAKDISQVKSYSAYLTTDYNDPFASGANPLGDNAIIQVNSGSGGSATIIFSNIKRGGPYFAVIAAYDDVIGSNNRTNLTKYDPSIVSAEKNWSRSNNSVFIQPSGNLVFSDGGSELVADLTLLEGKPTRIGFQTNIIEGDIITGPIGSSVN